MKRTKEEYEEAAKKSYSIAEMCRLLGLKSVGSNYITIKKYVKIYNIDISHFTGRGWNIGLKFRPKDKMPLSELLSDNNHFQSYKLKNRLFEENIKEKRCEQCGLTEWNGKEIPLELHHINGDKFDNRLENLQILCPNCHAQTDNYRGKHK